MLTISIPHRWGTALALVALTACSSTGRLADGCDGAASPIHSVQGAGRSSLRVGDLLTVRGVVVGDFQEDHQLAGFFLQDPQADADPRTSEGLFVFTSQGPDVAAGDLVRVTGRVQERLGVTELTAVESIAVCCSGEVIPPATLSLHEDDLEPYEGMLVALAGELTVADTHQLGRFGQILVAVGGRPFNAAHGGPPATADGTHRLLVDDGSRVETPEPPPYLDASGTRRVGDTVSGLVGVVSEAEGSHVLHPTSPPRFASANPRPATPPEVGGTVTVAGFNLLNFFLTLGERGATNTAELERQRAKHLTTLEALGADVVGLVELENHGDAAIGDLVDALNDAGRSRWDYVRAPASSLGDDVIRLGFLYRPATVRAVGAAVADLDPVFKRPPFAQTFEARGERFTVVVNHFKSKGCGSAEGIEKDARDGQGCWNPLRTRQARRMLDFVAELQAASGDPDVLVIGDLNAYGGEDPIRALTDGGLIDQIATHVPATERYSYVFRGTSGYLDHALTTPSLAPRVTGAAFWHVNSDEPAFLDYNTETNPPDLYRPDPFRSSDHDPVLIGLAF